ncbi:tyrosine-protein kinase receptor Tie-1-like, partial [Anneissia japonica]|uniref:tyrosine-protein kinase receptor Tie-1-like n=1 Tax=Anneissia japonica TaxID=1529436 RepID=UPI0014255831
MIQFDNAESSLKIGGYAIGEDRTNNINFGRRVDSGTGVDGHELHWLDNGVLQTNDSMFPVQSVVLQTPRYDFTGLLLQLPANISAENIGAFYSWATIGLLSTNVTTFTISKEAKVRSKSTTIIVGVGELVELEMEIERNTNIDKLRWRHNGGGIINDWNGKTKVIIESVRTLDGGLYECYFEGERELGLQSYTQLIVRGCPSPRWDAECDKDCPVCYNGGVCHPTTGNCVCPSGFMGDDCSEPCGDNNWGRSCSAVCSTSNRGCGAILFCLPEPMGCSCMAGYKGHDCKE